MQALLWHFFHSLFFLSNWGIKTILVITDIPTPFGVRAEVTAGNTSIRVSWQWSHQGVPMCVGNVRVDYQPQGGSLMSYTCTVGSTTTATSATLLNLQCDTKYTVWVHAYSVRDDHTGERSAPGMVFLPASGKLSFLHAVDFIVISHTYRLNIFYHSQPLPLPLRSLPSPQVSQVSG